MEYFFIFLNTFFTGVMAFIIVKQYYQSQENFVKQYNQYQKNFIESQVFDRIIFIYSIISKDNNIKTEDITDTLCTLGKCYVPNKISLAQYEEMVGTCLLKYKGARDLDKKLVKKIIECLKKNI